MSRRIDHQLLEIRIAPETKSLQAESFAGRRDGDAQVYVSFHRPRNGTKKVRLAVRRDIAG